MTAFKSVGILGGDALSWSDNNSPETIYTLLFNFCELNHPVKYSLMLHCAMNVNSSVHSIVLANARRVADVFRDGF